MEIINPRSALLSNFEVLALLRELEVDHLSRTKTALRIKKEEESAGHASSVYARRESDSENLRTVEIEAIQHLSAQFQPTAAQTPEGITQLVKDLAPYDLTKAEKLQVVNLAPTEPVELYVIVEELEDRLPNQMDAILTHVRGSLRDPPVAPAEVYAFDHGDDVGAHVFIQEHEMEGDSADVVLDEDIFDDAGEGAGVEGDLDQEEE